MDRDEDIKRIVSEVIRSKKYRSLYICTVTRIVSSVYDKYPKKHREKAVKKKLHQIWGAYSKVSDFRKILVNLDKAHSSGLIIKPLITDILKLQSSTKERLSILEDFYSKIFAITGTPKTVIEPACGLNALTYLWIKPLIKYIGFDIDENQVGFLNTVFKYLGLQNKAVVKLGDILINKIPGADMIMLLKVLPLLEHQKKGCSLDILRQLNTKYIIVSFPTKSLNKKNKGMVNYYKNYFFDLVKNESWKINQLIFKTELVFIIKK